jgi:phage shock protein C
MQVNRRLYRCRHDKRLAGVAAGVAEYFELDPSLVRVLWFVSIFFGGVTLLLYIGMAIIVPLEPISVEAGAGEATEAAEGSVVPEGHRHTTHDHGRWTTFVGLALIFVGSLALIDRYLPALDVEHLIVPAVAIGIGAFLVASAIRRDPMES